jgi:hypothetical protein
MLEMMLKKFTDIKESSMKSLCRRGRGRGLQNIGKPSYGV